MQPTVLRQLLLRTRVAWTRPFPLVAQAAARDATSLQDGDGEHMVHEASVCSSRPRPCSSQRGGFCVCHRARAADRRSVFLGAHKREEDSRRPRIRRNRSGYGRLTTNAPNACAVTHCPRASWSSSPRRRPRHAVVSHALATKVRPTDARAFEAGSLSVDPSEHGPHTTESPMKGTDHGAR
jgi:hypothetical protein